VGEPEFPLFLGSWHTSPLLEILLLSSLQASSYRAVLPSDSASWGRKTEGCEYLNATCCGILGWWGEGGNDCTSFVRMKSMKILQHMQEKHKTKEAQF